MTARRHHLSASLIGFSDYDSEANNLSDLPPPSGRTPEELNVSVLRRYDQSVVALEHVAPYVVVYTFSPESQGWEKSGIEGTSFICRRSPTSDQLARYAITILNRRGLGNFHLEIAAGTSVEMADDIVILQSESSGGAQIHGFWVYSEPPPSSTSQHRETFMNTVKRCAEEVERAQKAAAQQAEEPEPGVPMGRQVSLQEIWRMERQQDDAWSVRSHSPQQHLPQFTTSADTDFFRSSQQRASPRSPAAATNQSTKLLNLLRGAAN